MNFSHSLVVYTMILMVFFIAGCANTEYKVFEGKANIIEGKGGTKVIVDGMEIWDNGEPPRKFKILGIIEDERSGGVISMWQLRGDIVEKARKTGGDAIIQLRNSSQISGYYSSGSASAYSYGNSATAYGSSTAIPIRRNSSKFAVIKYIE